VRARWDMPSPTPPRCLSESSGGSLSGAPDRVVGEGIGAGRGVGASRRVLRVSSSVWIMVFSPFALVALYVGRDGCTTQRARLRMQVRPEIKVAHTIRGICATADKRASHHLLTSRLTPMPAGRPTAAGRRVRSRFASSQRGQPVRGPAPGMALPYEDGQRGLRATRRWGPEVNQGWTRKMTANGN
jgi:hypothetical protein